jgi:3-oxoadipate enol-lactonase
MSRIETHGPWVSLNAIWYYMANPGQLQRLRKHEKNLPTDYIGRLGTRLNKPNPADGEMCRGMMIKANGAVFGCEIGGREGAPWVTFNNSLATDLSMWDDQVAALKADFRILRYDKRGHGASPVARTPYALDDLVGDVVAIWDALGVRRSHVVGLSIGGRMALRLAIGHPERLLSAVISNTRADVPDPIRKLWQARIDTARRDGMDGLANDTVERWCSPSFFATDTAVLDKMRAMVRSTSVDGYVQGARALMDHDDRAGLGGIGVACLFIAGRDDTSAAPDHMRAMSEAVPGARFVELAPAGHISNMEQPEAYNVALGQFLLERAPRLGG